MRDEDFQVFIDEFGEATHRVDATSVDIEKWRGKLPDQLLTYWKEEGWCGYANGLFWTVNPDDYEDLVDEWLEDSPLEQIDAYHVVARTAFGELFLCGEQRGCGVKIVCSLNAIFARDIKSIPENKKDRDIRHFFAFSTLDGCDLIDANEQPLFVRTLKTLGPLAADEMYGFEPAIVLGGQIRLENLRKVKLDQHLTILRQFAAPTMPFGNIDVDKLLGQNR